MSPAVIFRSEDAKESAIRRIKAIKPDQEKPLAMWVGPYKQIRSLEQNAAYWRLVSIVSSATGHSRDVLHQYFKRQAFGVQMQEVAGQMVEYVPSSAKVSKGDFSELIEHVQEFIAENRLEEAA